VLASDPLYDDEELRSHGFEPWDGSAIDAVIVQADHSAYAALSPSELPGARAVLDGRGILDPARWAEAGIRIRRIGSG
jgi:UDP-N-acetyl-D-mannosaminuronic acid dehydrogenase